MIQLTDEQSQALAQSREKPPVVVDPRMHTTYVLVRKDVYERLHGLLGEEMPDVSALVNEVMAEDDAGDPLLEEYQHYRSSP